MDVSLFIARLAGPVLIVAGVAVLINPKSLATIGREILDSSALLFLVGLLTLVIGLVIVNTHNIWVADWRVAITVFGWLAVASGIVRTVFPAATRAMGEVVMEKRTLLIGSASAQLALGLLLLWAGYLAA